MPQIKQERNGGEQCSELEKINRKGRSDLVYEKVKELTQSKRSQKTKPGIKNRIGVLLTQSDDIKCRWKEYIKEVYAKDEKPKVINIESKMRQIFTKLYQR